METIPFKVFNTLSRQVETFTAQTPGKVSMYTCGPTVYGYAHLGNIRTFTFEDVLVKTLRRLGYEVHRVMNITDVGHLTSDADSGEDKLEVGAKRDGITAWDVADRYTTIFLDDLRTLNLEIPNPLVRATDTIQEQIALVQTLEQDGFTYITSDGVYFDSAKLSDYGKLAHLDIEGLQAGARIDIGEKHHVTDFALWKFSPQDSRRDMEWESPWGKGFPGWHLECSAIIHATLGTTIDIHCGGVDHIPVHHTNEIAQSETAYHKPLAHYWCHADFLLVDGGKMSKSLGNLYTVKDLEQANIDPIAFKLFSYAASYRSKLNFTWDGLEAANRSLQRLRRAYHAEGKGTEEDISSYKEAFIDALADDLNTAQALAVIWKALDAPLTQLARQAFLSDVDTIFSLNLTLEPAPLNVPNHIKELVDKRSQARKDKDWTQADLLRHQIEDAGFTLSDTVNGTVLL